MGWGSGGGGGGSRRLELVGRGEGGSVRQAKNFTDIYFRGLVLPSEAYQEAQTILIICSPGLVFVRVLWDVISSLEEM